MLRTGRVVIFIDAHAYWASEGMGIPELGEVT